MDDQKNIKLYYISPRDVLKARVDPIVVMKTCYALSKKGINVVLVYPFFFRKNNLRESEFDEAYQINHKLFKHKGLPTLLWDSAPVFWIRVNKFIFHFLYALFVLFHLLFTARKEKKVIYSKCVVGALPYLIVLKPFKKLLNISFIFELHTFVNDFNHRVILKNQDSIICISESLRDISCNLLSYPIENTTIAKHSVEQDDYDNKTKTESRKFCNIPDDKFVITYTGKVYYGMKEIDYLLKSAHFLKDMLFVIVGGKSDQIKIFQNKCIDENLGNVIFPGFVNMEKVQHYQVASDILVLYYPGDWPIKDFLSPGKLIEYMATGNAIISVNFKSLMEVLINEQNALIIEPDNTKQLVESIEKLRSDKNLYDRISKNAKNDSYKYTWESRAENIIKLINKI